MPALRRILLRFLAVFRSGPAEADLAREINAHLRLLEDQFIAQGMSADDARYAARRAFGGVEQAKEHQRDARSFRWLAGWSLDLKLGARMLIKYPGLTLVGGVSIAFAIAIGAAAFEAVTQLVAPTLPLDQGHRIVGIRNRDVAAAREEQRMAYDFAAWREELDIIQDLGAFRTVERNLIIADRTGEPIQVAEISASAFTLVRVLPVLGRGLVSDDEKPGAAPVAVIGHDVWQRHFDGDPAVVGRTARLGNTPVTVVGVMPDGFGFPVSHRLWTPLQFDTHYGRRDGPEIRVFGRLAPGISRNEAQAALTMVGARAAARFPDTHAHLRPEIVPYAKSILDVDELALGGTAFNVFVVMFLVLVCANVASLVFARAVTRQSEILVRTALGASRGRIVMQLFAEALVLGGVAAAVGLAAAGFALKWWMGVFEAEAGGQLPFWMNAGLSPATIMYAIALTALGAAVTGVVPALKVTGRSVEGQLRRAAAGGTNLGFGGLWTVVIVAQVAVTVAFPATAFFARRHVMNVQSLDSGFPAEQYLSARLEMDADGRAKVEPTYRELKRRLATEPRVAGVTFADRLPRTSHPERRIEIDGDASDAIGDALRRASRASVAVDFFDVLGAPILSGRSFGAADVTPDSPVVVVNQSFVQRILRGQNPVGRHVRYVRREGEDTSRWYEIVGVVKDLGVIHDDPSNGAGIYHPVAPGVRASNIAVHVYGDPEAFAPRLRAIAGAVEPNLRLYDVMALHKVGATLWMEMDFLWRLLVLVSSIALLLSLAGIYSIMSFTVTRRTREIGVRVALGANPRRIVAAIFSRAAAQVGLGIIAGGLLVLALTQAVTGLSGRDAAVVVGYMAFMMAVCLLACVLPTRRALRVQPTVALRVDA